MMKEGNGLCIPVEYSESSPYNKDNIDLLDVAEEVGMGKRERS